MCLIFIMAEGRGDCLLVHDHHLLTSCPGFYQNLSVPAAILLLCLFSNQKAPSVRRVLCQYAERVWKVSSVGTNHLKRVQGGSLAPKQCFSRLKIYFSGKYIFL